MMFPNQFYGTLLPISRKFVVVLILFQASSLFLAQGVSGACEDAVNLCGNTMFAEIAAASGDNTAICAAVDTALGCVATETASCDLLAKADIIAAMDDIIGLYKDAPYNCALPNANNAAYDDPCADALSYCVNIYYEAEYTPTTTESCQGFDRYLLCLQTNTTSCDATAQTLIAQTSAETVSKMNADPYFCSERNTYDIAGCESGFYECVNPLSAVSQNTSATSNQVCSEITVFTNCVTTNNAKCSPRLQQQYNENAANLTVTFQGDPYYCGSANPCMEAFKGCNTSENVRLPAAGCGLLDVYDACFATVSPICDSDKLAETTTEVNTLKQQLTTDFGCATTTTTPAAATTTTTSASTTTTPVTTTTAGTTPTTTTTITTTANGGNTSPTANNQGQNQGKTTAPNYNYDGAASTTLSFLLGFVMLSLSVILS
ncbi:mucin-5AC-like [Haliotis rufescens]|uniref:mucin-5AC-like n=1 Tax=Haliotis rufescens TaxID=6454 RepID=UPI00201F6C01|nr:mucin-5AC-like [Haliotis rufescens]